MHPALEGALIGGGVGAVLAVARRPAAGQSDDKASRVLKSAAEGALAGAAVGFALDRSVRRKAASLLASAPVVVEAARDRAVDAYESARPRVEDAVDLVRARALELRSA